MKKVVLILFIFTFVMLAADWEQGGSFKMHYPQLPDPNGWDIPTPDYYLADDFMCTESGPITDIHFWISYYFDIYQEIGSLSVKIYSDQPAYPPDYSHPLEPLWSYDFSPNQFTIAGPWTGDQGWYVPPYQYLPGNHQQYWQINIENIPEPFIQTEGVIYWLGIQISSGTGGMGSQSYVGWKTSLEHWNDNAVFGGNVGASWDPLFDPAGAAIDLAFVITNDSEVPVNLSSFTAVYNNGIPNLFWTTQSETNNIGWNIYRSENEELEESIQINSELYPGAGTTTEPTDYVFEDDYEVEANNEYWYWLESYDTSGETDTYGPISLTIPEEDPNTPVLPSITLLKPAYPNPFNPNTTIEFDIKEGETGTLTIFNFKGQILFSKIFEPGFHTQIWNAENHASGVYFYKLQSMSFSKVDKMILIK